MFLRRVASRINTIPKNRSFSRDASHDLAKAIAEMNKEMEYVFGEPPASTLAGSSHNQTSEKEPIFVSNIAAKDNSVPSLSHIDSKGEAKMVDISSKEITNRVAIASCRVILGRKVFDLVSSNQILKGDVLSVAKIAGIGAAKQTSNLIPLCHNINLTNVSVNLRLNSDDLSIEIEGEASLTGKTGVEMEALTAVTVAGLTVYDMCKAASKDIVITDVKLEHKNGGKSGNWTRRR